ncbi:adenylyl cyclase-associated protein 1 [Protobothrops mucrosquamatus]|uniref:adenylyl cyclase-associated protein 1 n=1 Tax=Protobothrops mucrosquamatus TaxID=103944 RepID=UPI000775BDFD|nr:adenylyl cyclase-associated protein 1 [Protobothrops mucrosquamatus]
MTELQSLVERLEKAVGRLEMVSRGPGVHGSHGDSPPKGVAEFVQAFDELLAGPVAAYMKISREIGSEVQKHAEMVHAGLMTERILLMTASQCQQPIANNFSVVLKPISDQIQVVQNFREKNRGSKFFNHLSTVSESIPALGWVAMGPQPTDAENGSRAPVRRGPPPPPPGPPPPPAPASPNAGSDSSASRSALFAQINQGEAITTSLKHVSDEMKTHKNPSLKSQGGPVRTGPKPFTAAKPTCTVNVSSKLPTKKEPPMLELEGKKWRVENQENASNLVISGTELKQVAYVYKCVNSTLRIQGKINSITLDNCKKLGLVFDDVVGIVEIINSRDVQIQVMGKVPTISINKTDGCQVYLSKSSLECEIVSAKSSEMNVLVPTDSGDFNEFPVPEQFKTQWNGQKLVTTVTEIAG